MLKAHLRLARSAKVLPSMFYLRNIEDVQRMVELQTHSTDIYRGVYQGQKVFLKRYRVYSGSLSPDELFEVSVLSFDVTPPLTTPHSV